jgi:uracil-DNA glycosylase
MIINSMDSSWEPLINNFYTSPLKDLQKKLLDISYQPKKEDILKPFLMPLQDIKVVIIGNEPEISPRLSNGLAFGRNSEYVFSHEMLNIKQNIENQSFAKGLNCGDLEHWQQQGVFLLNSSLTVETGIRNSHKEYWRDFIKKVVTLISMNNPCIWLLWGEEAKGFARHIVSSPFKVHGYDDATINQMPISSDWNYILESVYPTNKEFLGNNHFLYTNIILQKTKSMQITW